MLRLPQLVRLLATLALLCASTTAMGGQTKQQPAPPAKGKAAAAKSAQAKARASAPAKARQRKAAAKAPVKAEAAMVETSAEGGPGHRRDPFHALISNTQTGPLIPTNLPAGKAGLMVSTLRVDGIVRGPNGMLVVVTNPQQRTYFLRQGDRLYDGTVEQITMDGVTLKEMGKDPFGKPIERTVTKRIYPSAGEQ